MGSGGELGRGNISQTCPDARCQYFPCLQRGGYVDGCAGRNGGRSAMAIRLFNWDHSGSAGGMGSRCGERTGALEKDC